MGTVGLSFGSPTSGTGFDVSSTVASIVSNLQAVETPWQNQLTSLESQNTVISSLGTLFSNLSNDMSQLTDFQGILAEKEGSSSDTNVLTLTNATASAVAGTYTVEVQSLAQTSSGYLTAVNASDTLSGSITLQVGTAAAQTITLNSSDNTLAGLASAINSSGVGVTANVMTTTSGSVLSLVSGTSGTGGDLAIISNITDANPIPLGYNNAGYTSSGNFDSGSLSAVGSSDTLSGSISIAVGSGAAQVVAVPGTNNTLQGLADAINGTSGIGITASVVTSNGQSTLSLVSNTAGSAGALTVTSSVTDSAPTLGYNSTVTGSNAELTINGIGNLTSSSNTVSNLIPGVTFQLLAPSPTQSDGSLEQVQVIIGNDNSDVESTVSQFVSDYNSLISALNEQQGNTSSGTPEPLFGSPTLSLLQEQLMDGLNAQNPNGTLTALTANAATTLSGSISIQVGSNTAENFVIGPGTSGNGTIYTGSGVNTLSGLADAINAADLGVTASVVTSNGQSTLALTSDTAGSSGALTVTTSSLTASTPAALTYSDAGYSSTTADSGTLGSVAASGDTLSGTVTLQVGSGTARTFDMSTLADQSLSGLAGAINAADLGVSATVVSSNGMSSLSLQSSADGAAGALSVTSNLYDTSNPTTTPLSYSPSSDVNSLTSLGISVNNDGSLTFDASSLDAVLNSDYNSVVGFFQNTDSWGQNFSNVLTNAGTSSSTGMLALDASSNSSTESSLNSEISNENSLISAEQASLTAELNSANEIMQELPSQLDGMNELYSAITGYNENTGS